MNERANAVIKEVTKDQLVQEFNAVVKETEQLLKSVASVGSDKADAMREGLAQHLAVAGDRLRSLQHVATEKTRAAARVTDKYVHENPWQSIGMVAGVTAAIGVVIGLLLNRR